jgi:hypothetical protein
MKRFLKFMLILCTALFGVNSEPSVNILNAGKFIILAKSGITNVPQSFIKGDIAVSPISSTSMTGFSFLLDADGTYSKSSQLLDNKAYAANYNEPIPTLLTIAVLNMESAYTDAAGRLNTNASRINFGGGQLGGVFGGEESPLTPGIYTFGTDVTIVSTLYLEGNDNQYNRSQYNNRTEYENKDVFIIQMSGNLIVTKNTRVILLNGVLAKNVFWQVAGNVNAMVGSHLEGVLLVKTDVNFLTGSSLNGRILTQTACNLQMALIEV